MLRSVTGSMIALDHQRSGRSARPRTQPLRGARHLARSRARRRRSPSPSRSAHSRLLRRPVEPSAHETDLDVLPQPRRAARVLPAAVCPRNLPVPRRACRPSADRCRRNRPTSARAPPSCRAAALVAAHQIDAGVRPLRQHDVEREIDVAVLPRREEMSLRARHRRIHEHSRSRLRQRSAPRASGPPRRLRPASSSMTWDGRRSGW